MTDERPPQITALVTLGGDFVPEELTDELPLEPTSTWVQRRPELRERPDLSAAEWSIGVQKLPTYSVDDAVSAALDSMWEHRARIVEVTRKRGLSVSLTCSVTIWGERPVFELVGATVGRLAELGASFGLDIHDYSDDDEDDVNG